MRAGCIPIYWGNPDVVADFNPKSFINVRAFKSDDEAIKHILEVWNTPSAMQAYLEQPYLHDNIAGKWFDSDRVATFLSDIIDNKTPIRQFPNIHKLHRLILKSYPYLGERLANSLSKIYLQKITHNHGSD